MAAGNKRPAEEVGASLVQLKHTNVISMGSPRNLMTIAFSQKPHLLVVLRFIA